MRANAARSSGDNGASYGPDCTAKANTAAATSADAAAANNTVRHSSWGTRTRNRCGVADPIESAPTSTPTASPRPSRHHPATIFIAGGYTPASATAGEHAPDDRRASRMHAARDRRCARRGQRRAPCGEAPRTPAVAQHRAGAHERPGDESELDRHREPCRRGAGQSPLGDHRRRDRGRAEPRREPEHDGGGCHCELPGSERWARGHAVPPSMLSAIAARSSRDLARGPAVHHDHAIRELEHFIQIARIHDHGRAGIAPVQQMPVHGGRGGDIQPARWILRHDGGRLHRRVRAREPTAADSRPIARARSPRRARAAHRNARRAARCAPESARHGMTPRATPAPRSATFSISEKSRTSASRCRSSGMNADRTRGAPRGRHRAHVSPRVCGAARAAPHLPRRRAQAPRRHAPRAKRPGD